MPNQCENCKKNVTKVQSPGLSCINCNKFWHFKCANLSEVATKEIIDNKLSWTCKKCNRRSTILPPQLNNSSAPTLSDLSEKYNKLEDLLNSALKRIESLEEELVARTQIEKQLTSKVEDLEAQTNTLESKFTDNALEIQGLPESALENPISTITAISNAIGLELNDTDFEEPPSRTFKRISLTFKSKAKRKSFLLAGKKFNKEKRKFTYNNQLHRIHVNEVLTDQQKKLFRDTKAFASTNNFKFVWVAIGGKILLKKDELSIPHIITSSQSLSSIINHENSLPELQGAENEIIEMSTINNST